MGAQEKVRRHLSKGVLAAGLMGLVGATAPLVTAGTANLAAAPAAPAGVVPFAMGHVLPAMVKGKAAQPPTTAECESAYGIACYQAFQLQKAYDLGPLFSHGIEGQGQTIVIVDAFGSPSIQSDLQTFDAEMNLPDPPSFQVITPEGAITTNASNCTSTYSPNGPDLCSDYYGWTDETSLDVEWSHAMAPEANILLVETPMTESEGIYGLPQIVAAENYVINHHLGQVITQSFGANEQTFTSPRQILSLRYAYENAQRQDVTVLAASGDQGATDDICDPASGCANPNNVSCCEAQRAIDYPSSDPLVTAVGGTQLQLDAAGNRIAPDRVWDDLSTTVGITGPVYTWGAGGGGRSSVFSRPDFQNRVTRLVGDQRGTPDVAMSAAVNGAVDFYDTTDPNVGGWSIVGGTSEASPLFSGIVALADQFAGRSIGYLNPILYSMHGANDGIVPISQGNNTYVFCPVADTQSDGSCASSSDLETVSGFQATGSYSDATGLGTVDAAQFVPALAHAAERGRGRS